MKIIARYEPTSKDKLFIKRSIEAGLNIYLFYHRALCEVIAIADTDKESAIAQYAQRFGATQSRARRDFAKEY